MSTAVQTALKIVYPPRCLLCGDLVDRDFGLCGGCWRETPLISGLVCDLCGVPLPGENDASVVHCDKCLTTARPWSKGRAALVYKDNARRLVLALKHGDRHDVVHLVESWMIQAASSLVQPSTVIVPVPLHWSRMLKRKYNQSALMAQGVAQSYDCGFCPDALVRGRRTPILDGLGFEERFQALDSAISPHPKKCLVLKGAKVLLVDDVMTSGATLSACAQACLSAGADEIFVLVLARVAADI
ncbi:MAG: ComF family protein [Pseudomonadota bacterium]